MQGAAKFIDLIATAPWAPYTIRPAPGSQIGFAGIFIGEHGFKFGQSHLSKVLVFIGNLLQALMITKITHLFPYVKR